MTAITAESHIGRTLLALRAGEMTAAEISERWPSSGSVDILQAVRKGYAEKIDDAYRLTDAGRAACPLRNPLAASSGPINQKKEPCMTTEKHISKTPIPTPASVAQGVEPSVAKRSGENIQLSILKFMREHGEPVTATDVAKALNLNQQPVWNAFTNLYKAGKVDFYKIGATRYYGLIVDGDTNDQPSAGRQDDQAAPVIVHAPVTAEPVSTSNEPAEFGLFSSNRMTIKKGNQLMFLDTEETFALQRFLSGFRGMRGATAEQ